MGDLPRLKITREQVDVLLSTLDGAVSIKITLHLPERPTWTCATCQGVGSSPSDHVGNCPDCDGHGSMPIPEGTRVEVGWWEHPVGIVTASLWHPVATATVDHIERHAWGEVLQHAGWRVTLTDVRSTDG